MNVDYVVYDSTGLILRTGSCPESMVELQAGSDAVLVGIAEEDRHYVLNGEVLERPSNPATLVGNQLTNVPYPSVILIDGEAYDCGEDTVTLNFGVGKYAIEVQAFPYLPFKVEFTI